MTDPDAPMPMRIELVERLVSPTGLAFILRARLRGAEFQSIASVAVRNGRFCAELQFVTPIGPEKQTGLVVMLSVLPEACAA